MLFRELLTNWTEGRLEDSKLVFYTKRLAKETSLRRTGAALLVIALVFQVITFVSPPKPSSAASQGPNDVIPGGFASKADLLAHFDHPPYGDPADLQIIYAYFGVVRQNIVDAGETTVSGSSGIWSVGRQPHSSADQQIDIPAVYNEHVFIRPLSSWGTGARYRVLVGTSSRGQRFYILFNCGNIAFDFIPPPPPPAAPPPPPGKPRLTIAKTAPGGYPPSGAQVHRGDELAFHLPVSNIGNGTANNVIIEDAIPKYTTGSFQGGFAFGPADGGSRGGSATTYYWWKLGHYYTKGAGFTDLRVKVNNDAPNGARICNTASVRSDEIPTVHSQQLCFTVVVPQVVGKPNLHYAKTADNLTLTLNGQPTNAAGTTVPAGTSLRYNLRVQNTGTAASPGFVFSEDIGDILDYATVTNTGGGVQTGSTLNWPAVTIGAGQQVVKSFVVQVKNPIPSRPTGVSDPQSFDLHMDNVFFANAVRVSVPTPPVKSIEEATRTLPQTGAGVVNAIVALVAAVASFLYLRARLLGKELAIASKMKGGA